MPVVDIVFTLFPTQEDFLATNNRREIHQATVYILDFNIALVELEKEGSEFSNQPNPIIYYLSSNVCAFRTH